MCIYVLMSSFEAVKGACLSGGLERRISKSLTSNNKLQAQVMSQGEGHEGLRCFVFATSCLQLS
jgi:hypothetical protein